MGLLRWFTKNWANTNEPTHPDLKPRICSGTVETVAAQIKAAAATLRGWKLASETSSTLHFVRRTRAFRFADDVRVTLRIEGESIRVDAESRSRLGKGDLGQNRRNIRELWAAMTALSPGCPE